MSFISHLPEIGTGIIGRAVTETLYVSPEGAGTNGKTWGGAFTTIQAALAVASTDPGDCTLIMISPHATNYDINTDGDPTWTGNYILKGAFRNWAKIKNEHETATSVMKFTGKVAIISLNINLGTGNNGLILTHGGSRVLNTQFVGEDLTSVKTCLHLDHASTGKRVRVENIDVLGNITYCRGILVDNFCCSHFKHLHIHACLEGIQIVGTAPNENVFKDIDIGGCSHANGIALNIDDGSGQHFDNILFHGNTKNVDDEVKDHSWSNIYGQFPIELIPVDLNGLLATAGDGATGIEADWGDAVVFASENEIDQPFRIVGVHVEPVDTEWHELRFSGNSGAIYHDRILFRGVKKWAMAAPSGTEFIFNAGTELYCQMRSESGGNNCQVWIEIQKI